MKIFLIYLLLIISLVLLAKTKVLATLNTVLYFTPQTISVSPNETFSLNSTINPGTNKVSAVDIEIIFNPLAMQLNSVTPISPFTMMPISCKGQTPTAKPCIDNNVGTASFSLIVPLSNKSITSITNVVTFSFTAKSNGGVFTVDYDQSTQAWETGVNVLQKKTSSTVNIAGPTAASKVINPPSTPVGACGRYNSLTKTTPITFSWNSGIGLQIWDNAGYWWYNSAASSPFTISSKDNFGRITAIPAGRTIYARTTFTWHKFSAKEAITCSITK